MVSAASFKLSKNSGIYTPGWDLKIKLLAGLVVLLCLVLVALVAMVIVVEVVWNQDSPAKTTEVQTSAAVSPMPRRVTLQRGKVIHRVRPGMFDSILLESVRPFIRK